MKNLTSKELIDKLESDEDAFLLDVRSEKNMRSPIYLILNF